MATVFGTPPIQDRALLPMSNAELAAAIVEANNHASPNTDKGGVWLEHLKALLAAQLRRAAVYLVDVGEAT